jgi:hypothetical protein
MATVISGYKVSHQMFKCFNCGRKSVSLNTSWLLEENRVLNEVEDDDLEDDLLLDSLELVENDWLAACAACGWLDS